MRRYCGEGRIRALFFSRGDVEVLRPLIESHAHGAVMPSITTAAGRQIGVGAGSEKRRDQRPAEQYEERDGRDAAHRWR
jgi:hypothetical protein